MSELGALVQEGLGHAVLALLPLVVAALLGSALAGWLALRVGLQDPVAAGVLRGLAVLGALALFADELVVDARRVADEAWSALPSAGRAER